MHMFYRFLIHPDSTGIASLLQNGLNVVWHFEQIGPHKERVLLPGSTTRNNNSWFCIGGKDSMLHKSISFFLQARSLQLFCKLSQEIFFPKRRSKKDTNTKPGGLNKKMFSIVSGIWVLVLSWWKFGRGLGDMVLLQEVCQWGRLYG